MKCVNCQVDRKYITERAPCCNPCAKKVPTAMSTPGLFIYGAAALFARATEEKFRRDNA